MLPTELRHPGLTTAIQPSLNTTQSSVDFVQFGPKRLDHVLVPLDICLNGDDAIFHAWTFAYTTSWTNNSQYSPVKLSRLTSRDAMPWPGCVWPTGTS